MAYIGVSPSNGVRRIHTYTATANQTTFTGSSTEGVTLTYADTNYIDVFQNGVLLGSADYTSTSGTSVVLAQGASVSDLVVIVVYDVFSVADTVSKTAGGSFDSAVTMSGGLVIADAGNIGSASDTDAMAISSGGVVTFSQAPVGAGSMIKLYDQSVTGVANVTVDSTIINSTYDNYYIIFDQVGATDGQYLAMRLAVGGSVQTGSNYYGYEAQRVGGSYGGANQNTSPYFAFFTSASLGNATGEGVQAWAIIQNVNSTVRPCSITGLSTFYHTDAAPNHSTFGGSVTIANRTSVVNGIQFLMDSGNIAQANFKIYGIK